VSPATYATPLLTDAFLAPAGSQATVLEIGYPRNDVLVSPAGDKVRRRTRELLGVRDDQVVVMYAPTFRDYLSADDMTARRVDFFDAHAAARQLGDRYVVLVRGHAFNARANSREVSAGNVIDVTDHPNPSDLILASDAAVLDYSSIRFDYGLTDKPMVFLVPDLQRYDKGRGGVIDYAPTAPGPRVRTTREVIRLLADLPALRRTTAPLIAQFRREYVDLDDGHAAARLVDAVFVPRGDAPPDE
jgi:CDP-glycerol glycerophosphotransferase